MSIMLRSGLVIYQNFQLPQRNLNGKPLIYDVGTYVEPSCCQWSL